MDKIDKLLDTIEHPERYSDAELEVMLADPEVREVYELLAEAKSSFTPISTPDVEAEWKEFNRTHRKRSFRIINLFSRNVAASIALGVASLAAVAAVVGVSVNYVLDRKTVSQTEEVAVVSKNGVVETDTISADEEPLVKAPDIIIFNNEDLEEIAAQIAKYYDCKVEFLTKSKKSLRLYFRWNQAQTLDEVIESLNNFEQIHIIVKDKTIKID